MNKISAWLKKIATEHKLETLAFIFLMIFFATMNINRSRILAPYERLAIYMIAINMASMIITLLIGSFSHVNICLMLNIALYPMILNFSKSFDMNILENSLATNIYGCLVLIFFVVLLVNILSLCKKLVYVKKPEREGNTKIDSIEFYMKTALYKIRFIYPVASYIILIFVILYSYSYIYENYIGYAIAEGLDEGLFYTGNIARVSDSDILYFSTTTFCTVGYGDIVPMGSQLKLLVQSEMLIGSVMTCLMFPILLMYITNSLNIKD